MVVQGSMIRAQLDAPGMVEIPSAKKSIPIDVRITLMNDGEDDFVAHAESPDETHFWHVFDDNFREVQREPGRGKGGHRGVQVIDGVHSYRTVTVAAGHGTHGARTLTLDATKLRDGQTYTIRGEIYGHIAETQFAAVAAAAPAPRPKRGKTAAKKAAAKKVKRKK